MFSSSSYIVYGAIAQSPGREAALAWASLAQRFPASSVLAREGASFQSAEWAVVKRLTDTDPVVDQVLNDQQSRKVAGLLLGRTE